MNIKKIEVGLLKTNCYIIEKSDKCLVIDPGDEIDKIMKNITHKLSGILITHHHFDHVGALSEMIKKYNVGAYDYNTLKEGKNSIDIFDFEVIYTPGHTNDSVSYYFYKENIMFTGDFIFKKSIGRWDLGGNEIDMKESINKVKKYKNDIKIYPGHGESTLLLFEKENNIYFK